MKSPPIPAGLYHICSSKGEIMESEILQSVSGIINFLKYFGGASLLLVVFIFTYSRITPYDEIRMIRDGKTAPAISLGGAILGYVFPMYSAIAHSVSLVDMVIWALIALVVQLIVFVVLRILFSHLIEDMSNDKIGPAVFLAVVSIAAGLINAACMTY